MKYEFFDHTADVKFRAYGQNLAEKFSNAALAMFNVMTTDKVKPKIRKEFSVSAKRERTLLYEFLEQFLEYVDSEGWLLSKIEKIEINDERTELSCTAVGDTDDYEIETQVKSITYHEMEINDKYLQVVLDI